jgi:general secretion pathway protein D
MKTILKPCLALWFLAASFAAQAQVPPPPAEGPAARPFVRPTNAFAPRTNAAGGTNATSIFSRNTNFGRPRTDVVPNAAAGAGAAAAAGASSTTTVTPLPAVPAVPGTPPATAPAGAIPAIPAPGTRPTPLVPALPGGPSITSTSANFAATNIIARGTDEIPAKTMYLQEADLSQVFILYSELTGRTIIRSPQVPANVKISIINQTPLTRQEGIDALNTLLGLNQIVMVPEGEKFIKAVPQATAGPEAPAFTTNNYTELRESKAILAQMVTLKHLQPDEAVQFLQPFANLPNSIIGLKGSPVLILRDYSENVKRMMEILERVDVAMPLDIDTVVIPIKYALAGEIASVLSGLGATTGSGLSGGASAGGGGFAGTTGLGGGTTGFGNTGVGGGGFNSGMGRTGMGMNTGMGNNFGGTRGLGTTTGLGGTGGNALGASRTGFGNRLNQAVNRAVSAAGGGAPGEFVLIGNAKIIPDERSNALLVFADRRDLPMISNIISKLDVVLPQVLIEALIMEVNLGDGKSLGVSLKQNNQQLGDLNVAGGSVNGPGFLDPRTISGITAIGTNAANSLPSGFSYFGKLGTDLDFAITAAATDSRINVLSRPRIQTSTAKPASIFVGETRPYVTGTYFSDFAGTGSRSQYQQFQIGISLNVLPIINQEGLVVMDIAQDISQVGGTVKVDNNDVPITINRTANAYVAVHDRDTIILGGFISTTKNNSSSGVPFLKDIPGLGMLFRSSSDNVGRVELMVLIRPTVLPTPEAAALEAATQRDRSPEIKRAEREEREFSEKRLEKAQREEEKAERRKSRQ